MYHADFLKHIIKLEFGFPFQSTIFAYNLPSTIAAKILWSSLFDTSNVNKVLMSIYLTISNYSCQKYGIFSF
jgi:hypothetical protein